MLTLRTTASLDTLRMFGLASSSAIWSRVTRAVIASSAGCASTFDDMPAARISACTCACTASNVPGRTRMITRRTGSVPWASSSWMARSTLLPRAAVASGVGPASPTTMAATSTAVHRVLLSMNSRSLSVGPTGAAVTDHKKSKRSAEWLFQYNFIACNNLVAWSRSSWQARVSLRDTRARLNRRPDSRNDRLSGHFSRIPWRMRARVPSWTTCGENGQGLVRPIALRDVS